MMEWTLAILFGTAVVLFILSFLKTMHSSKEVQQQIDHLSFSLLEEITILQEKVRNIELDAEITAQEMGTSTDRLLLREVLDLHKRGYSFESIATKKQLTTDEIEHLLTPYIKTKDERSNGTNDI